MSNECSYCQRPLGPTQTHYLTRVDTGERLPVHIECHVEIREMVDLPEHRRSDQFGDWLAREDLDLGKTFDGWRVPGDY